jgi:glycosyltransferase involved in cell wall biosynthesis
MLSGYLNACLRELALRPDVDLFVSYFPPHQDAPFDDDQFAWIPKQFVWRSDADLDSLDTKLDAFKPDAIVLCGWGVAGYRKLSRKWKSGSVRILAMDNHWLGTPRQWAGVVSAPLFVRRLADAIWVPGERQAQFARKLGFQKILSGLYSCDTAKFSAIYNAQTQSKRNAEPSFLFVGRMIKIKGIATLASAYKLYRSRTPNPWPLVCCGHGPLVSLLEGVPGVRSHGFIQPDELPEIMAKASCLVLPSEFDPFPLVILEATTAGLVILASEEVGNVPHLVQNKYNGFTFPADDAEELSRMMEEVSQSSDEKLNRMAEASSLLARQFTPQRWADTLLDFSERNRKSPNQELLKSA